MQVLTFPPQAVFLKEDACVLYQRLFDSSSCLVNKLEVLFKPCVSWKYLKNLAIGKAEVGSLLKVNCCAEMNTSYFGPRNQQERAWLCNLGGKTSLER